MAVFVNEEQWLIDGLPLSTWAYNIESLGGRLGIPVMAGENFQVPYRAGEVWRSKLPAARTLSLGMWVRSTDANGVTAKTATARRAQFNENMRSLRNMFYNRERLLTLTKSVRYLSGIQSYTTKVECMSTLEPTMSGPNLGKMVVDLKMVDPYWLGGSTIFTMGNNLSGATLTNPGDDTTVKIIIQVTMGFPWGGGTTILRNTSFNPEIRLSLPNTGPAGGTAYPWTVDVENFFLAQSGDFSTNRQNSIASRSGSAFWFALKKGDNNIIVDSRYGDGSFNNVTVQFTYYPVYL